MSIMPPSQAVSRPLFASTTTFSIWISPMITKEQRDAAKRGECPCGRWVVRRIGTQLALVCEMCGRIYMELDGLSLGEILSEVPDEEND